MVDKKQLINKIENIICNKDCKNCGFYNNYCDTNPIAERIYNLCCCNQKEIATDIFAKFAAEVITKECFRGTRKDLYIDLIKSIVREYGVDI